MSIFGREHLFAVADDGRLDRDGLVAWLKGHQDSPILIFGFTFMVWEQLVRALRPGEVDLWNAVLIHSGGSKKLTDRPRTPPTSSCATPQPGRSSPTAKWGSPRRSAHLPETYPGHSVLTEDFARVEAVDDCPCGRRGKTVSFMGRVPEAELRGCSDVRAAA